MRTARLRPSMKSAATSITMWNRVLLSCQADLLVRSDRCASSEADGNQQAFARLFAWALRDLEFYLHASVRKLWRRRGLVQSTSSMHCTKPVSGTLSRFIQPNSHHLLRFPHHERTTRCRREARPPHPLSRPACRAAQSDVSLPKREAMLRTVAAR